MLSNLRWLIEAEEQIGGLIFKAGVGRFVYYEVCSILPLSVLPPGIYKHCNDFTK